MSGLRLSACGAQKVSALTSCESILGEKSLEALNPEADRKPQDIGVLMRGQVQSCKQPRDALGDSGFGVEGLG